jgi:hypothetical protein
MRTSEYLAVTLLAILFAICVYQGFKKVITDGVESTADQIRMKR